MRMTARWLALGAALVGFPACAGQGDAVSAALALAEAHYPGQLSVFSTRLEKNRYHVTLAVKGDPVTRIAFFMDPDPATCVVGSDCDARFRRAYGEGLAVGAKLKALDAAFGACGVKTLGLDGGEVTVGFRTVVELDMAIDDQQPALDQMTPCIAAFRRALPADASPAIRALQFRIQRPGARKAASRVPLRFENNPSRPSGLPTYLAGLSGDDVAISADMLRLSPDYLRRSKTNDKLVALAASTLAADPAGGAIPKMTFATGVKLDPKRLDVIRAYVPACSTPPPQGRRCRTDMAVRMRYDLTTGKASEVAVIREARDARGALALPPLIGR